MTNMMQVRYTKNKMNLDNIKEGIVRVGFFEGSKYEGNLSVAQVARWNELGIGVPKRPFMRPAVHRNKSQLYDRLRSDYKKALANNTNTMDVLDGFGLLVQGLIQNEIINKTYPRNADITIYGGWMKNKKTGKPFYVEGKGKDSPLRNTRVMLNSVSHQEEEIRK